MSRCSSSQSGLVSEQCSSRQIIYTILVTSCSITTGMCLEWAWYVTDMKADACAYYRCRYHSVMLRNVLYLGAIVSAGPAAFVTSLIGLKTVLFAGLAAMAFGSGVIVCSANVLSWLYVGRVLHGLGTGIVFVVVPNYASEIPKLRTRSVFIGLHYLSLLIGVLLSQVSNEYYIYSYINRATIAMALLNLVTLCFVTDPPCYRLKCTEHLNLKHMCIDKKPSSASNHASKGFKNHDTTEDFAQLYSMFTKCEFRGPICVNVFLMVFHQFTGFVLLSTKLKCLYGILHISEMISDVVAVTLFQVISCILCLLIVDILKKKTLLFISGLGMTVTLCLMNVTFNKGFKDHDELWLFCLISIYIFFYSIGYGPIPWILMPQLCPKKSRLWTTGFTVSLYALLSLINNQFSIEYTNKTIFGMDIVIMIFTMVNITGIIFAYKYVPEIKKCIS